MPQYSIKSNCQDQVGFAIVTNSEISGPYYYKNFSFMKNSSQLVRDFPPFPDVCLPRLPGLLRQGKREKKERKKHTNS